MELILYLVDFIIHIDKHLTEIIAIFGAWTYIILFLIIFIETGLVVTPFLPGDSLLFVVGAFSAAGALNVELSAILLIIAALTGNTVNYFIGKFIGQKILQKNSRFIKKEHLDKTHSFYEKYGGKTIIVSRFLPIIRTIAPFIAGISRMNFLNFTFFNVVGGVLWVLIFVIAGYTFGNVPIVKNNFSLVIFLILFVSILPAVLSALKVKKTK